MPPPRLRLYVCASVLVGFPFVGFWRRHCFSIRLEKACEHIMIMVAYRGRSKIETQIINIRNVSWMQWWNGMGSPRPLAKVIKQ